MQAGMPFTPYCAESKVLPPLIPSAHIILVKVNYFSSAYKVMLRRIFEKNSWNNGRDSLSSDLTQLMKNSNTWML